MAEEGHPPQQQQAVPLPRRVPGAAGRTPPRVRRGVLPVRQLDQAAHREPPAAAVAIPAQPAPGQSADQARQPDQLATSPTLAKAGSQPAAMAPPAVQSPPAAKSPAAKAASPAELPRRSPGASPLRRHSRPATPPRLPARLANGIDLSAAPATADPAIEAAVAATQSPAVPGQAPAPAAPAPLTTPPRAPAAQDPAPAATAPPAKAAKMRSQPSQRAARRSARRWQLAGLIAAVVVLAAAALLLATRHTGRTLPKQPSGAGQLAAAARARQLAVAWVTAQVGHQTVVACDPDLCAALAANGFPAGDLSTIQPSTPDPLGSGVVVASADIRSQFGSKLADVFAPEVLASFGQGTGRIVIREMAPEGATAFRAALSADLAARKSYGASLLHNKRVVAAIPVQQAIAAGGVDARLLDTFAFLASQQPIRIVALGSQPPGASPGVPLRVAYLSETDRAAGVRSLTYLRSLVALLQAQRSPFKPTVALVHLPDGLSLLKVSFTAPSPLGLLSH